MRFPAAALLCVLALPAMAEQWPIAPGPNAEEQLTEALILAQPGDEIVLAAGRYDIRNQLILDVENVTLRGAGMGDSILSYAGQTGGGEGLLITADGAILKDFAVEDTKGDGIKSKGVDGIAFVRVRAEWTNGPDAGNGAYGLYPVQSTNVLIDGAEAIGASDAGIYVGQSQHIIVRNSRASWNVAGLEIENSYHADVHDNLLQDNTGGILVFDLPDLPQQGGHHVRVFDNVSRHNNTANFAPEGNIVGLVPAGTGMLIMANRDVEVFGNTFEDNNTVHILFGSYIEPVADPTYRPHPQHIHIHDNTFGAGGETPDPGDFGGLLRDALGVPVPDIVWDGVMPVGTYIMTGPIFGGVRHAIRDNRHADPALAYGNADFMGWFSPFPHRPRRNIRAHSTRLEPLPEVQVTIRGVDVSGPDWRE